MSPLALHRWVRCLRRHLVGVALVMLLAGAVAAEGPELSLAGTGHHGGGAALVTGVGVLVAVEAAVVAVAIGVIGLGRWRPAARLAATGGVVVGRPPFSLARAGPPGRAAFCSWRR